MNRKINSIIILAALVLPSNLQAGADPEEIRDARTSMYGEALENIVEYADYAYAIDVLAYGAIDLRDSYGIKGEDAKVMRAIAYLGLASADELYVQKAIAEVTRLKPKDPVVPVAKVEYRCTVTAAYDDGGIMVKNDDIVKHKKFKQEGEWHAKLLSNCEALGFKKFRSQCKNIKEELPLSGPGSTRMINITGILQETVKKLPTGQSEQMSLKSYPCTKTTK